VQDVKLLPAMIKYVSENRPEIENIVLEDCQYSMSLEFMARSREKGFDKFVDIGVNFASWMQEAQNSRDNLKVFIIWHPEKDKDNNYKMKTVGSMVA
jgi:SRSO17 transposase